MNSGLKIIAALAGVVLAGWLGNTALAGGGGKDGAVSPGKHWLWSRCARCGRWRDCEAVCRLKKEPLTRKITCWTSETEPVCLPGPSRRACRHVEHVSCDAADKHEADENDAGKCPSRHDKKIVWFDWCIPGEDKDATGACHRVATRKKLMRKEIEVPIKGAYRYRWETLPLCKSCAAQPDAPTPAEPADEVPPAPPVEARARPHQPRL